MLKYKYKEQRLVKNLGEKKMTNFEKYYKEIVEKKYRAVKNGKPISCKSIDCAECELYDEGTVCAYLLLEWLTEEQKPTLAQRQRALREALKNGYIARDENGRLFWHREHPIKRNYTWHSSSTRYHIKINTVFPDFPFIIWEDEEPHSVKEMLKWEVEE